MGKRRKMKTVAITLEGRVSDSLAKKLIEKGIYIKPVDFIINIKHGSFSKTVVFKPVQSQIVGDK